MNIVDVFANVSSASKQDEKKTILKEFGNDSLLTMIFNDTYDKSVVYNVTSKNLKKYHSMNLAGDTVVDVNTYKDFHNLLARLSNRSISGNEALGVVASFIQQFTREDADLLMKILDRNLKIGVTLTQFNKWFGQESWKFEVPLAYLMEKVKNVNPIDGTYYASHKLDGCRLLTKVDCDNKEIKFYSRSGKEYTTLSNLKEPIFKIMKGKKGVWAIDGECCYLDENGVEDFQAIMKEITRKNHTIVDPHYCVFDMVTWEEFTGEKKSKNFTDRYEMLLNLPKNENIIILEQERITSQEIFDKWAKKVVDNDWEGFMLRKDAPFKSGRSKDLMKYKPYDDAEYVVKDVINGKQTYAVAGEGNQEFEGVKDLVIEHKGCEVHVGSGLSKEQRLRWFEHPEEIIGKTITVKFLEETQDQNGKWSLRHPTLKFVYEDGRNV